MADYFESGFCVRERSWHGKELLLDKHPETWAEARTLAGLDWEPEAVPLYRTEDEPVPMYAMTGAPILDSEGRPMMQAKVTVEPNAKRIVRNDNRKTLGVVSDTFELILHAEMGIIIEEFLGETNVKFDTGGSVRGGAQVYATMLLDEPYQIVGDVDPYGDPVMTLPYFVLLNSHNGTGSCKGLYTQVRVVCANTYQAADMDGDRTGAQFIIRHTSGAKARVEEAREIIAGARKEVERWRGICDQLHAIGVTSEQEQQFLDEFIPTPPEGTFTDRVRANIDKDRANWSHIYRESATNCAQAGTALGLVNSAVEYLDHVRGFRNQDTYMGRQILTVEPMKAKALKIVRQLTGASV